MDEENSADTAERGGEEAAETKKKLRWNAVNLANVCSVNGALAITGSLRGAADAAAAAGSHVVGVNLDRTSGAPTQSPSNRQSALRVRAAVASSNSPMGSTRGALQA